VETTAGVNADVTVTGSGTALDPYIVTFVSLLAATDVAPMTGDATSLGGSRVLAEVIQAAAAATNEVQEIGMVDQPTGGTFTLTLNSETTGTIAYNATAATVQAAIEALATPVPGDVAVHGGPLPATPIVVEFKGAYAGTDVAIMTANGASLTGSNTQTLTVSSVQTPTGPHHVDNVNNWSLGTVPVSGEDILIARGESLLYGLTALAAVVPNSLTIDAGFSGDQHVGLPIQNEAGYAEYRQRQLQIGGAGTFPVYIGLGEGNGSNFIALDLQTAVATVTIYTTGSNDDGPAVELLLNNVAATVNLQKGNAGIGIHPGQTSSLATFRMGAQGSTESDSSGELGPGVTMPTVVKNAGYLLCHCPITTSFTQIAGETDFEGAGTMAQLYVRGGTFNYNSIGSLNGNTVVSGDGKLVYDNDSRPKAVANPIDVYGEEADVFDVNKVATTTGESPAALVIDYNETTRQEQLGLHYRMKRLAL
jgi:hypothetical protein